MEQYGNSDNSSCTCSRLWNSICCKNQFWYTDAGTEKPMVHSTPYYIHACILHDGHCLDFGTLFPLIIRPLQKNLRFFITFAVIGYVMRSCVGSICLGFLVGMGSEGVLGCRHMASFAFCNTHTGEEEEKMALHASCNFLFSRYSNYMVWSELAAIRTV